MSSLSLRFPEPDIAQLVFDLPGRSVNLLSPEVLEELRTHLEGLADRRDLAGLLITSGKPESFIAGADLRQLASSQQRTRDELIAACTRGKDVFRRLESLPFVTVAAINGPCVGGGAELACWCDRRVLSAGERTEIGFPEVKIGLIPGWGGTVRAPRLLGLPLAIEMITSGESVDAVTCRANGLAHDVVPPDQLLAASIALVRDEQATQQYRADRQRWKEPVKLDPAELAFVAATSHAQIRSQTRGQYPAPAVAQRLLLETASADVDTACRRESEEIAGLFGGPVNAALLNVFFLTERARRDLESSSPIAAFRSIGVVGAGTMGAGIAAAHVKRELSVILTDAKAESLARGTRQVIEEASYDRRKKQTDAERGIAAATRLSSSLEPAAVAKADLVIEAIVENRESKQTLLAELEQPMRDDAVLVSNTSTIPIARLAETLQRPERFAGLHFFSPVRRMKLIEVIRGPKTSDETVAALVSHAKRLGKLPIVVRDGPGFLVNRILFPYLQEALQLLAEGVDPRLIEQAAVAFGMPMGPLELYDMVGLDTAAFAGRTLVAAFRDRAVASPILPAMLEQGRLGHKSGRGFYIVVARGGRQLDPELGPWLAPHRTGTHSYSLEVVTWRLFLPMVIEASRVLEEGSVEDPRDIDIGVLYGLGFPTYRGGLLFWADSLSAARLLELLAPFGELGPRYHPTAMLRTMARDGTRFYRSLVSA